MPGNLHVFFVDKSLESDLEIINTVTKTVKRLYKSSIQEINAMYLDDIDFEGLFFWFNDAKDYIDQINKSMGALK